MRFLRISLFGACVAALSAGCGPGVFGIGKTPSGNIVIAQAGSSTPLVTSAASPFMVPAGAGAFSIAVSESGFQGNFTAAIVQWANGTNKPCFAPVYTDPNSNPNVITFSAVNAQSAPPNPCASGAMEQAQLSDGRGHSTIFYYKI